MMFDTTLVGIVLATVLLKTRQLDAFSVTPASALAARCVQTAGRSHVEFAQTRRAGHSAPSWTRFVATGRRASSALCMSEAPASVEEVTQSSLEDREFQLEELEDRDVMETSVVLNKGGAVTAGTTNGPLPMSSEGSWSLEGDIFNMEISRTYDASISPYVVTRTYNGYVDEVLPATDTVILTGDINMDGNKVGFFKMISAPSDILDSLKHIDEKITEVQSK